MRSESRSIWFLIPLLSYRLIFLKVLIVSNIQCLTPHTHLHLSNTVLLASTDFREVLLFDNHLKEMATKNAIYNRLWIKRTIILLYLKCSRIHSGFRKTNSFPSHGINQGYLGLVGEWSEECKITSLTYLALCQRSLEILIHLGST